MRVVNREDYWGVICKLEKASLLVLLSRVEREKTDLVEGIERMQVEKNGSVKIFYVDGGICNLGLDSCWI